MDKLKQWVALTVVGSLAILAAGWFLVVSPKRAEAADVRAQAEAQLGANQVLTNSIKSLKAQAKLLPQQQAKLAAVAAKIPDNPALPSLIRALTAAADDAGVELVSLAPTAPVPVLAAVPATPVVAAAKEGEGKTPTAKKAAAPSVGAAGQLLSIGLTVSVVGGYFQVEQFLDRVENLTRAMKVTGFTLAPGTSPLKKDADSTSVDSGRVLIAAISGNVYLSIGRQTTTAAVVGK